MGRKDSGESVIILANGDFPTCGPALGMLEKAGLRVCCDGSAQSLVEAGWEPDVIVGDMDSLSRELQERFHDRIVRSEDQDSNDLTKAVHHCVSRGYRKLILLGATGKREDHSLGNISLMTEYAARVEVRMISDYGEFFLVRSGEEISSRRGEQISVFSLDNTVEVHARGLRYPLDGLRLSHWYTASLNEATGESFRLDFNGDYLIIYRSFG